MSDKTPGADEFDELANPQVATPSSDDADGAVDEPLEPLEDALASDTDELADEDAELADDVDELDALDDEDTDIGDDVDDALDESASVPAVASGVTRRTSQAPVRKSDIAKAEADAVSTTSRSSKTPAKKAVATRKQADTAHADDDPYGSTNPATFVKQSASELGKVVWPTWPQLMQYFLAVLVFVLFFIAFVGALDLLFGWGLLSLFGEPS